MLYTLKRLMYHLLTGTTDREAIKPSTVFGYSQAMYQICDWMHGHGIRRFAELGESEIGELRIALEEWVERYLPSKRKWSKRVPGQKKLRGDKRLRGLRELASMGDILPDVPQWNPALDPLERARPRKGAGQGIPAIPDDLALVLFAEALEFVTNAGPLLVRAKHAGVKAYLAEQQRVRAQSAVKKAAINAIRAAGGVIRFAGSEYDLALIDNKYTFNRLVTMLETACYIITAGFSGMRVSELSDLLVDCLEVKSASSGAGMLRLVARGIKTAVGYSQPESWIVGYDTPSNEVRIAVETMRDLATYEREHTGETALFLNNANTFSVGQLARVKPLTEQVMNGRLNMFLRAVEPKSSWRLTTHQFRKTFARFVARHHKMALLALKRHFKHVSLAMTDLYLGRDYDLLTLISEERRIAMHEDLNEILGSSFLGGKLGERIVERNECFRGLAGQAAREEWIEAFLTNGDITILTHAYGICFLFRDTARCGSDISNVGLSTCGDCSNLVVTLSNVREIQRTIQDMDRYEKEMVMAGFWNDARAEAMRRDRNARLKLIATFEAEAAREAN